MKLLIPMIVCAELVFGQSYTTVQNLSRSSQYSSVAAYLSMIVRDDARYRAGMTGGQAFSVKWASIGVAERTVITPIFQELALLGVSDSTAIAYLGGVEPANASDLSAIIVSVQRAATAVGAQ